MGVAREFRVFLFIADGHDEMGTEFVSIEKNELLSTGHYTDAVDEVIEKVMKAKIKNVHVKEA